MFVSNWTYSKLLQSFLNNVWFDKTCFYNFYQWGALPQRWIVCHWCSFIIVPTKDFFFHCCLSVKPSSETLSDESGWGHVTLVMWWTVFWWQATSRTYVRNWCTTKTVAYFLFFFKPCRVYFLAAPSRLTSTVSVATAWSCTSFQGCCCCCFQVSHLLFLLCTVRYCNFVICYWLTLYFLHTSKYRIDQRCKRLRGRERASLRRRYGCSPGALREDGSFVYKCVTHITLVNFYNVFWEKKGNKM